MHAVSISLGSTNAIVAVAAVTATTTTTATAETTAPIRVTANSAGHRATPVMVAFSEHGELLFGEDARAMYARTPEVVVPYLFAFSSIAHLREKAERKLADAIRRGVEDAAKRHYKGHCPIQHEDGSSENRHNNDDDDDDDVARRLGFVLPQEDGEGTDGNGKRRFLVAEEILVEFFNHIKRHTVDAACGLTATAIKAPMQDEAPPVQQRSKIVLTVVVPRHLFPQAVSPRNGTVVERGDGEERCAMGCNIQDKNGSCGGSSSSSSSKREDAKIGGRKKGEGVHMRRWEALQWVKDAILRSHLGAVAEHVSLMFADEAALFGMDAVGCHPHESHLMADRHFLLPPSATIAEPGRGVVALPWPFARVLVVDWGALGVSLTHFRLEGGFLVDEPQPAFLRACDIATASALGEVPFLATTSCGGGDAVNLALRDRLATTFAQQQRRVLGYHSLSDFPARAQRRLLLVAEEKKVAISRAAQVPVEIEALAEGIDLRDAVTFSRTRVDAALRGEWRLLEAFENVLREYLQLLHLNADGVIDAVVLCGGMLQMPYVAQSLRQLFVKCAAVPDDESRFFARNLVIMEAGLSTTVVATDDNDKTSTGLGATLAVANNTTVGAEELVCVGGCLHSYHLAQAALQDHEHRQSGRAAGERGGKGKRATVAMSRRQRERAEGARRVWHALAPNTANDGDDSGCGSMEMMVLQHPILLYTHASVDALVLALDTNKKPEEGEVEGPSAPLKLPAKTLTTLFAAHTPLPSRVVIPLEGRRLNPLLLYLFTESCQEEENKQRTTNERAEAYSFVTPLTASGVTLPVSQHDPEKWKQLVVLTLRASKDDGTHLEDDSESVSVTVSPETLAGAKLSLVVQLVRVALRTPEPLVLGPNDVQASITVDLRTG